MAHSEICPVCKGTGWYEPEDKYEDVDRRQCHGCDGNGWVTVGTEYPPSSPWPMYEHEPPRYHTYIYEPRWGAITIIPDDITITGTTYQLPENTQTYWT